VQSVARNVPANFVLVDEKKVIIILLDGCSKAAKRPHGLYSSNSELASAFASVFENYCYQ
jgi:hypothetical protein